MTSLIEEFQYPKLGPGMMWERCQELVEAQGSKVVFDSPVTTMRHRDGRATQVVSDGTTYDADHVISSMPFNHLLRAMDPPVPAEVQARRRRARVPRLPVGRARRARRQGGVDRQLDLHPRSRGQDHAGPELRLVVALHGAGRPQRPRPRVHGQGGRRVVDGDRRRPDREGERGARGARADARPTTSRPATSCGCRRPTRSTTRPTGPTWRSSARGSASHAPNVHPVGRNGMHRYNNQDHSMFTAMLTVENILGADHDIWDVNVEEEYHEERRSLRAPGTGRDAPVLPTAEPPQRLSATAAQHAVAERPPRHEQPSPRPRCGRTSSRCRRWRSLKVIGISTIGRSVWCTR